MSYFNRAALAVLALFAFAGTVQAGTAVLTDPDPVAIPANLSQDKVVKDIKRTLAGRGWSITEEKPGEIASTLNLREHVARIRITYDNARVQFAYVDSQNLKFAERHGKRTIHSNYLGWIGYLTRDLSTNLQLSAQDPN